MNITIVTRRRRAAVLATAIVSSPAAFGAPPVPNVVGVPMRRAVVRPAIVTRTALPTSTTDSPAAKPVVAGQPIRRAKPPTPAVVVRTGVVAPAPPKPVVSPVRLRPATIRKAIVLASAFREAPVAQPIHVVPAPKGRGAGKPAILLRTPVQLEAPAERQFAPNVVPAVRVRRLPTPAVFVRTPGQLEAPEPQRAHQPAVAGVPSRRKAAPPAILIRSPSAAQPLTATRPNIVAVPVRRRLPTPTITLHAPISQYPAADRFQPVVSGVAVRRRVATQAVVLRSLLAPESPVPELCLTPIVTPPIRARRLPAPAILLRTPGQLEAPEPQRCHQPIVVGVPVRVRRGPTTATLLSSATHYRAPAPPACVVVPAPRRKQPPRPAILLSNRALPTSLPPRPVVVGVPRRAKAVPHQVVTATPVPWGVAPRKTIVIGVPTRHRLPTPATTLSTASHYTPILPCPRAIVVGQPIARRKPGRAILVATRYVAPLRVQAPAVIGWPPRAKRLPTPAIVFQVAGAFDVNPTPAVVVPAPRLRRGALPIIRLATRPTPTLPNQVAPRVVVANRPPFRRPPGKPAMLTRTTWLTIETPPDLMAAAVAYLRRDAGIMSVLGESLPSTPKIAADKAETLSSPPYLVYWEPAEEPSYQTGRSYIAEGQFAFACVAAGKKAARDLARRVASILDDAPLVFEDGRLMMLRHMPIHSGQLPDPGPGPDNTVLYQFGVAFGYAVQRDLNFLPSD